MSILVDLGPDYEDADRTYVAQNRKSNCVDYETFDFHNTTGLLISWIKVEG
jgi:hypothetical protein